MASDLASRGPGALQPMHLEPGGSFVHLVCPGCGTSMVIGRRPTLKDIQQAAATWHHDHDHDPGPDSYEAGYIDGRKALALRIVQALGLDL